MSLNGLESPKVTEAYEAAVAESGGWVLLKYISRDEIELHGAGPGGVAEAREAIQAFGSDGPLFGLIRYRRRSILIKYVPEGTSRLAQARATVHFQAISERFSPHDAILPISTVAEVNDTTLSQACQLHTASGSLSSATSSLRRRRLGEITEAAEENSTTVSPDTTPSKRTVTNGHSNEDLEGELDDGERTVRPSVEIRSGSERKEKTYGSAASIKDYRTGEEQLSRRSEDHRRRSSASVRPSTRDLYESPYSFNGKVKYAPRPSLEAGRRPHTSHTQHEPRPVASLPAGIRRSNRTSSDTQSLRSVRPPNNERILSGVPEGLSVPEKEWRPESRASSFGGASLLEAASPSSASKTKLTPEKARLMKAMQLRQKQLSAAKNKQAQREVEQPVVAVAGSESAAPREAEAEEPDAAPEVDAGSIHQPEAEAEGKDDNGAEDSQQKQGNVSLEQSRESDLTKSTSHDHEETVPTSQSSEAESLSQTRVPTELPRKETFLSLDSVDGSENEDGASTTVHLDSVSKDIVEKPSNESESAEIPVESPLSKDSSDQLSLHSQQEDEVAEDPAIQPSAAVTTEAKSDEDDSAVAPSDNVKATHQPLPIEREASALSSGVPAEADDGATGDEEIPITLVVEGSEALAHTETVDSVGGTTTSQPEVTVTMTPTESKSSSTVTPEIEISGTPSIASAHASDSAHANDFDDAVTEESHLEELDHAVVEEAKPIVMPKSPRLPPFFADVSKRPDEKNLAPTAFGATLRSVSASNGGTRLASLDIPEARRKVSVPSPSELTPPKKGNVSSSLSSRIKAFEMLSSKNAALPVPPKSPVSLSPVSSHNAAPPLSTPKKGGFFSRGSSDKSSESKSSRPFSFLRSSHNPTPTNGTPRPKTGSEMEQPKDRQEQSASRPRTEPVTKSSMQTEMSPPPIPTITEPETKKESVSVIARIVRDGAATKTATSDKLMEGPIIIERKGTEKPDDVAMSVVSAEAPTERPVSAVSIPPPVNGSDAQPKSHPPSPALPTPATMSSQRSSMSYARDPARLSVAANDSSSSLNVGEEKKESRKSRLLRRMSTISSTSRKSIQQAFGGSPVKEEPVATMETIPSATAAPAEPETLLDGWVNVQLPDTLLWRRRCLKLTSLGYITLSHTHGAESSPQVKRYHLSDFKAIVVPDRDMEELPYSVILELEDGGSLQCACQDSAEQARVLQTMKDCFRSLITNGT